MKKALIIVGAFLLLCLLFPGDRSQHNELCGRAQEVKASTGASDEKLLAMGLCDPELERENLEALKRQGFGG